MATGDSIAQLAVERKELNQYNFVRTAKFASLGFLIVSFTTSIMALLFYINFEIMIQGPGLRVWYGVLDKYIKRTGAKAALMKTSADQLLFAPCFLTVFVTSMGALNGENINQIKGRLDRDFTTILITNWKVQSNFWALLQIRYNV
jgi:protein Mpv17